jgi:decaprenyl-phosphate phosphoribosyltransferase
VTDIPLSEWIVIMTFLLALFLALAKRRDDVLIYERTGKKMRKVIDGYNLAFLDNAMSVMSAVVIVAYLIYITSSDLAQKANTEYLYITAAFVILGVLRYLQITLVDENSSSPTKVVLKDMFMQVCIVCWLLTFAWLLYF